MSDILNNTYEFFVIGRPNPTSKDIHSQIGCHFEEVGEMLDTLTPLTAQSKHYIRIAKNAMVALADHLKANDNEIAITSKKDLIDYLDALCDQIVTATGCAYVMNLPITEPMKEVNGSNHSKFSNGKPIYNANKKILKGPDYYKANLEPFIGG